MASAAMGAAFRHLRDLFSGGTVVGLADGPLLARYASSKDGVAFEALVSRHGPMVLATCRAILKNEHDVEDAFQATFLVLARRAGSIRGGDALGGWLHRVACRSAVQASVRAKRRRRIEAEASAMAPPEASRTRPVDDLGHVLHEEVDRLPEAHRLPVVLCDLEGLTYEQAARQLRWTEPTLRCRLAKGRERLRDRLTRRGITAPSVAALLATSAASASVVPAALLRSAVAAATGGATSLGVTLLTRAILRGMLMTKLKLISTAAMAALGLATAGVIAVEAGRTEVPKVDQEPKATASPTPISTPSPAPESGEIVRVVDPEGRPVAGAKVFRTNSTFRSLDREPGIATPLAETGPDGSFRLSPDDAKAAVDLKSQILARAEGYGPAFADPSVGDGLKVLHLVRDDVPIRGRVLDIEGRPVAGASVQLVSILRHPSGKLDEWLAALNAEKVAYPVEYRLLRAWQSDDIPSLFPAVPTDRQGRFTIRGVGRERIASMIVTGPGIETRSEYAATREMPTVKFPDFDRQNQSTEVTYHGASFDLVAGPGLEIVGTIRDKVTGKPIAGAVVRTTAVYGNPPRFLRAIADAQGRYRLAGVPPRTSFGDGQTVLASTKDGSPYVPSARPVGDERGPIIRDIELKLGAWARGRVTDGTTGKPLKAGLEYYILGDNPHLKKYPRYETARISTPFRADDDGRYEVIVLPGRGLIGARLGNDTYRMGVGIDKVPGLTWAGDGLLDTRPTLLIPTNYNTLVEVNPKEGEESVTADIVLDRGRTIRGTLVGPGGEPVPGARMMGAEALDIWSAQPLPSADFEVHSLEAQGRRGLLVYHEGRSLAGAYVVKAGEEGPVTVKLEPCGTLTGRLVDDDGTPRAGVQMTCDRPFRGDDSRFERGELPSPIKTDGDGRFRASGLVPGLKYSLSAWKGPKSIGEAARDVVTGPGESRDLGDLKVLPSK